MDEFYHALKHLLGQGREYTSGVFAEEITSSLLRAVPSLSCCSDLLPSLLSVGVNSNVSLRKGEFRRRSTVKVLWPNPDFLPL